MDEILLTEELFDYYTKQADTLLMFYNQYAKKNVSSLFKCADILVSFDSYYASLIILGVKRIREITSEEIKLLNLKLKYSSIFSHLLESEDKYDIEKNRNNIIQNANDTISKVPLFIKFGARIDKDLEMSHILNETTLSGIFYYALKELLIHFFNIEEYEATDILNPILNYYVEKRISLNHKK